MKHKNKLYLVCCFLLFLNTGFVFGWLQQDKEDILKKMDYVEENPEEPVLRDMYKRALQCYMKNDFENTVFFYKKLLEVRNNYKDATFLLEVVEKMMNYPVTEAKEIVINEYFEKGKTYYESQHYLAALNIWEKLLILEPKNVELIKQYIIEARRLLADPYYERGWDYYKTKEYDKAVDEWEHVLALVPSYQGLESLLEKTRYKNVEIKVRALLDGARKNYDNQNYKKALSLVQEVLNLLPKQEEASIFSKQIISKMRENYSKFYDLGVSKFSRKEYEKSIDAFNKALNYAVGAKDENKCNSYIIKARYELSKLRIVVKKEQKPEVVEEEKEEPIKVTKQIDQEEVRKHYTQGLYYYRNGYIEKAISEWEIVLNLDPENERAYTSLQRAKARLKKEK